MGYRHSVTTFPAICVLSGIVSNSFQACKAQTCVVQREYEGRFQAPSSPTTPICRQEETAFLLPDPLLLRLWNLVVPLVSGSCCTRLCQRFQPCFLSQCHAFARS